MHDVEQLFEHVVKLRKWTPEFFNLGGGGGFFCEGFYNDRSSMTHSADMCILWGELHCAHSRAIRGQGG